MRTIKILLFVIVLGSLPWTVRANEPEAKRPNVLFDVSATLLNAGAGRLIDQTEETDEVIQDTPIHAIARTVGTVNAELVPYDRFGVIDLSFRGCVWSRAVGSRGTIRIHTFTTTPLEITRRVVLDPTGIRVFPGPCCAQSTTELLCINSTMDMDRLALCMVEKGYWRNLRAAEAETAHKTLCRVSDRFDAELTPTLSSASQAIGSELATIKRLGLSLDSLRIRTTGTSLQASALISTIGREPPPAPALPTGTDLGVRVHESFFNTVAIAALGGRSFALNGVSQVYHEATRGLLRDGRKEADQAASLKRIERLIAGLVGKPAVITLATDDPLTVHFGEQEFTIEVHIGSITQEKEAFAGIRHKVVYRLENGKDGLQAVRKAPAQIRADPAQPAKKMAPISPEALLVHQALFAEVFPERLSLVPLPAIENVRLSDVQGVARDGWLTLMWKLQP